MELSEYQQLSRRTAEYPREAWLAYPALGLAGEAGEVAEHAKKAIRDDGGMVSDERRAAMRKELGTSSGTSPSWRASSGWSWTTLPRRTWRSSLPPAPRGALG